MRKLAFFFILIPLVSNAQLDSIIKRTPIDTSALKINQDALYNRPFISVGKTSTALGGYVEGNTNYFSTDGISEGFSMELRRFNIFLYSSIGKRIKFLSELEFEHGTEEISLETAQLDFEFSPALKFRAGIIVAPIGAFNQNHDGPKWEFIERPLMATQIIPSTLSEIGFGFHGKVYGHDAAISYEAYLVNGLRDGIILNSEGRTFLQEGKSPEMFGEDNNGSPMLTGKISLKHRQIAEIGFSYYGGIYNTFRLDGIQIDSKRKLSIFAVDLNATVFKKGIMNVEFANVSLDVPESAGENYGTKQNGIYAELVYPVFKRKIAGFEHTTFYLSFRAERIDYNVGKFKSTGENIYDDVKAIVPGISVRPSANTVIRFNYRYHWEKDLIGNPTIKTAGFQFGVASYF